MDRRRDTFNQWLARLGADRIVDILTPYHSSIRIEKIRSVIASRLRSIHVAVENPTNLHNALALVRSAEGFGLQEIHLIDPQHRKRPRGKQTTQGAMHWVEMHEYRDISDFFKEMHHRGFAVAGGVPGHHCSLSQLPVDKPLCVLLGNEEVGLSKEALKQCDRLYSIPMYGMSQSLNLSVSGALTLYDVATRRREQIAQDGDSSPTERQSELAWHLYRLIGIEKAAHYLKYYTKGVE